jgi:hypothetical protein
MEPAITSNDRKIIREAAKKQAEYAATEKNKKRVREWYLHNDLKGEKPFVYIKLGTMINKFLPDLLFCEDTQARDIERQIRMNYFNNELLDDDFVTPDCFYIKYSKPFKLFNLDVNREYAATAGYGHKFIPAISDLEKDLHKIKPSHFFINTEKTARQKELMEDLIGDILPVKVNMDCLYSTPTQNLVNLMGMEAYLYNIADYPELFKQTMDKIADDTLAYFDMVEDNNMIMPTVGHDNLGNGSLCYTNDLPASADAPLTSNDVWGFLDSQESACISSQMYEEIIFPCYRKIAARYGLLSYGCCEPVDPIWDNCLSKLPNLRKLSVSAWANEEALGERLRGGKVIYFRKPSSFFLGVDKSLDEDGLRAHFRKTLAAAQGCKVEIAQRDILDLQGGLDKARRFVEIAREEIESNWKG